MDQQPRFANVLKQAAQNAGLATPLPSGHFRGISLMEGHDTYMAQVAEISMDADNQTKVHPVVVVADLGHMVNLDTVETQVQSSVAFDLSAALAGQITLEKGCIQQTNFGDYPVVRMNEMPKIDVTPVTSTKKLGGIGQPATALIRPALANAVLAATGKRVRKMRVTPAGVTWVTCCKAPSCHDYFRRMLFGLCSVVLTDRILGCWLPPMRL